MRQLTTLAIVVALTLLTAAPVRAQGGQGKRSEYGETDTDPSVDASMDAERARANLRTTQGGHTDSNPVQRQTAQPSRPLDCVYIPYGTAVAPTGVPMLRYGDLRKWFKPGDKFGFQCHYLDDPGHSWTGDYVLGEVPPDAPAGGRQADAQAALDLWVENGFPTPVVAAKPALLDQRIAIATWFAVPTLTEAATAGTDELQLTARPRPLVTISLPVGRWGTETFECTASSVGTDGRPVDGTCAHAFQHATGGIAPAAVTIVFDVTYSSTITGELDVPVGTGFVARTSQIPMQVKEIQAVGR